MEALVCNACWTQVFNTERMQKFWLREHGSFSYTTTWIQIIQASEEACNWCSFLKSVLPSPDTPEWPTNWQPVTALLVELEEASLMDHTSPRGFNQCQIDFGTEDSSRDWHVEMDLFVDNTDKSAKIVTARPLQTRVSSAESYAQIEQWLLECGNHKACGDAPSLAKFPSRAIEVAPTSSPHFPRLRSTAGWKGQYLALSYCWGSNQSYVLTTRNLEVLTQWLDMELLPRTILDAIEITKALSFKYLWVDALCIMQDTAEAAARQDMDRELATMDEVYKNATMTIVAASARSAKDGFLENRLTTQEGHYDIPCRLAPEQSFSCHIKEHVIYDDMREPINSRAWTFQEQLLSPRLLIYASHTLQWQCRMSTCNLGGSYHSSNTRGAPRLPSSQMMLLEDPQLYHRRAQLKSDVPHSFLQHWLKIVTSYATRKSSLPHDKLPALAAFAASYASIFGPEYMAGIWRRSAVQQLCWSTPDSRRQSFTRPTQYRSPSWSWAALNGPVYFPSYVNADAVVPYHQFKIIEWQVQLKNPMLQYGEVTAGKLTITTVLRNAIFDPSCSPAILLKSAEKQEHGVGAAASLAAQGSRQTARGNCDTAEDNFTRPVRCLAMYSRNGLRPLEVGGLMLVESLEGNRLYRRIGTCSASGAAYENFPLDTVSII